MDRETGWALLAELILFIACFVHIALENDEIKAELQECQALKIGPPLSACTVEQQDDGTYVLRVVNCAACVEGDE